VAWINTEIIHSPIPILTRLSLYTVDVTDDIINSQISREKILCISFKWTFHGLHFAMPISAVKQRKNKKLLIAMKIINTK